MSLSRFALAAAALLAATAPVRAEPAPTDIPARARTLAERGRAHHDAGDYAAAIAAFTEAYALAPSPALLFNLAQSYRMGGHCDDAATMYKRFLASDPAPEARSLAETHLISVEECIEAERPPDAVRPPPAAVAVRHVDPAPTAHERRASIERDTGIGLGVAGGVALVGAFAFELRAHDASSTVSDAYAHGGAWSTIADANARGRHSAELADAFGVTGVVAIGAGAALYWMGMRESRMSHVAVVPTARGAEVHAAWRF